MHLVEQLRRSAQSMARGINPPAIGSDPSHYLAGQAADQIERLTKRVSELEQAQSQAGDKIELQEAEQRGFERGRASRDERSVR